jgi:hypothetical protein
MLMALVSILVQLHIDGCFLAPSFSRKQGGWIRYVYKSVLRPMQNMDSETPIPRWNLALVTLLAWVVGMAVALTPDGLALIEFKSALTAISPLLEDWNASDAAPCSWGGINCTDSGRVRNISLSTQQLCWRATFLRAWESWNSWRASCSTKICCQEASLRSLAT